jgi:hypothetical protein
MEDGEVRWSTLAPRLQALVERLDYIERHLVDIAQKGRLSLCAIRQRPAA